MNLKQTLLIASLLSSCFSYAEESKNLTKSYEEIDWINLMPQADLDALNNPPQYLDQIQDGSAQDSLSEEQGLVLSPEQLASPAEQRYQQALHSSQVKTEYNGHKIKIPGFIVPLEVNEAQLVTEFFLVPYFGACIHMPPPPPNQIIHIRYPKGLELESLYDAFWVKGTISTEITNSELGSSAYTMTLEDIGLYQE